MAIVLLVSGIIQGNNDCKYRINQTLQCHVSTICFVLAVRYLFLLLKSYTCHYPDINTPLPAALCAMYK